MTGIMRGPRAHSVRFTLEDGRLYARWTCHAAEGADCRMRCPGECEEWDLVEHDADHDHKLVDAGHCMVVEGLEAVEDIEDCHQGEDVLYDGPMEWDYDGGYTFRLPSPAGSVLEGNDDRTQRVLDNLAKAKKQLRDRRMGP